MGGGCPFGPACLLVSRHPKAIQGPPATHSVISTQKTLSSPWRFPRSYDLCVCQEPGGRQIKTYSTAVPGCQDSVASSLHCRIQVGGGSVYSSICTLTGAH